MKAVLRFDLPEDAEEFRTACEGAAVKSAVRGFDEWLRTKLKHGHPYKTADEALGAARDELRNRLADENVSLDPPSPF